ncbi:hypothetical protein NDU88_001806 [Pleurodeles waltl]|uniref:Uncharacterized protein n=1 Tax=Pleurodeles waltl TaxID=8319 RepID=A0AAV7U953_PLEWA|nr:hypothetical protein NDU88_001806 [Pleurodeles waltl]
MPTLDYDGAGRQIQCQGPRSCSVRFAYPTPAPRRPTVTHTVTHNTGAAHKGRGYTEVPRHAAAETHSWRGMPVPVMERKEEKEELSHARKQAALCWETSVRAFPMAEPTVAYLWTTR